MSKRYKKDSVVKSISIDNIPTAEQQQSTTTQNQTNDTLEFIGFGGLQEVGRSSFILSKDGKRILLDAGIKLNPFAKSEPPHNLEQHAKELDAIILSHAHIDHSGYIPALFEHGFKGKVYMTQPTLDIAYLLWSDQLKIEGERYWTENALDLTYSHVVTLKYNETREILPGITLQFFSAGHILGSAISLLNWNGYKILYTGDINDHQTPLFSGFHLPETTVDLVISETTNGHHLIPEREIVNRKFIMRVLDVLNRGHKVIIPAFAIGRSQEILTVLTREIHDFPIYVDGMINKMNHITERYLTPDWIDTPLLNRLRAEKLATPFAYKNIRPITKDNYDSTGDFRRFLGESTDPCVIITTSGMMMPSPLHTHLSYHGTNSNNLLAVVGYQADGTIGRDILNGERVIPIYYFRGRQQRTKQITLTCEIARFEFSGHTSSEGINHIMNTVKPKTIILVHGDAIEKFSQEFPNAKVYIPAIQEKLSIPTA